MQALDTTHVRSCLAAIIVAASTSLATAQTTDLLADSTQWTQYYQSGSGSILTVPTTGSNQLWYKTTTTSESDYASIYSAKLPAGKDWSIQSSIFINPGVPLPKYGDFVYMFFGVSPRSDLPGSRITYAFEYGRWNAGVGFSTEVEAYNAGTELVTGLTSPRDLLPIIALRMDYSAADQSITFLYDRDAEGTSYSWESQGALSLASYWLSKDNEFTIVLGGSSNGTTLGWEALYRTATASIAIPEPSTTAGLLGLAALAVVVARRRFRR